MIQGQPGQLYFDPHDLCAFEPVGAERPYLLASEERSLMVVVDSLLFRAFIQTERRRKIVLLAFAILKFLAGMPALMDLIDRVLRTIGCLSCSLLRSTSKQMDGSTMLNRHFHSQEWSL